MKSELLKAYQAARESESALRSLCRKVFTVEELLNAGLEVDALMKLRNESKPPMSFTEAKAYITSLNQIKE